MKKFLISFMVAIMCAMSAFSQIATLSHEGQISAFYGENALVSAMGAAAHGDIISLSSGRFNAVNITKRVTLRGTGMSSSTDPTDAHDATMIVGAFNIAVPDTLSERLSMESLYLINDVIVTSSLKNAQFTKCRFNSFSHGGSYWILTDVSFTQCRIIRSINLGTYSHVSFMNSIVYSPYTYTNKSSYINFDNCIVKSNDSNPFNDANYRLKNSIIHLSGQSGSVRLASQTTALNCIGICGPSTMFDYMTTGNTTNTYVSDITSVFKTYNTITSAFFTDTETFELTETAAQTYLGNDGTQVGIYGGVLPYDESPLNPKITKCNVASKTTADGKLSVDIEVTAAGY